MAASDPYAVLGVGRNASAEEIKSSFRKLARQYHPDVNPNNPGAEDKFKEINEAYSILSDPAKRTRFDQYGVTDDQPGASGPGDFFQGGGFGDLFESFFGGDGGRGRTAVRTGEDLRTEAVITLKEVLLGVEKTIKFRRMKECSNCHGNGTADGSPPDKCSQCSGTGTVTRIQQTFIGSVRTQTTCPTCRGEGVVVKNPCGNCRGRGLEVEDAEVTVSIPTGVDSGQTLRVSGRGSDGVHGAAPGDLYVILHVADDSRFHREGQHLLTVVEVTYAQAVIGDVVEIEGLEGTLELSIHPGTETGKQVRLKGQGLPRLQGVTRGDLVAELHLIVPKKVSEAQRALLKEFAELGDEPMPKGVNKDGFLGGLFKKKK